jgi:hypothetical protein
VHIPLFWQGAKSQAVLGDKQLIPKKSAGQEQEKVFLPVELQIPPLWQGLKSHADLQA